ncbi:MAG: ATP-binding cassette domain-containing protein [Bacteroidetes bacterium]|nr:ATP-binding cassette domain-containing protein [Bacteroidota bacterium]
MSYLEIENVTKAYAAHVAIKDLNFSVPKGCIFGLLGPNGAGKTSLIRIINQITAADSGRVLLNGEPLRPSHISKIGYLPEERGLYKKMKVLEQIVYFARLKDVPKKEAQERALKWLKHFEIESWKYKRVDELSKGMQQKVQFILTIIHNPELIILDEPFSGFDPVNTELIKNEIRNLRDKGATIIFSTHRMESVEEICDYIGMINLSTKVLEGSVREVRESFKRNEFIAEFSGDINAISVKPESVTDTGSGRQKAVFRTNTSDGRKSLIRSLNEHTELYSFEERLPSINEIFIQKVKEGKNG